MTAAAKPTTLYTVGYQRHTPATLGKLLQGLGITHLADVRAHAWSQRPEFCETPFRRAMYDYAVLYRHIPGLGNPYKNDPDGLALFAEACAAPTGELAKGIESLRRLIWSETSHWVLVCSEPFAADCHRKPLAEALARPHGWNVVHLQPEPKPQLSLFGNSK